MARNVFLDDVPWDAMQLIAGFTAMLSIPSAASLSAASKRYRPLHEEWLLRTYRSLASRGVLDPCAAGVASEDLRTIDESFDRVSVRWRCPPPARRR